METNTEQYEAGHNAGWELAHQWVGFVIPGHTLQEVTAGKPEAWRHGHQDALDEAADFFEN